MGDINRSDSVRTQLLYDASKKSVVVAYLLLIFLGAFGAHRFYLGHIGTGLAQLALNVIGWLLVIVVIGFIPLSVLGLWLIVDLFLVPGMVQQQNVRLADSLTQ